MKTSSVRASIIFLIVIIILVIFYGSHKIVSDGVVYYAQTESLVRDLDFDLTNQRYLSHQWKKIGIRPFANPNRYGSFYPGGIALFYAPFLWFAEILEIKFKAIEEFNNNYFLLLREKIPLSHSLAIFASGLIYLFFCFLLPFKAFNRQDEKSIYIIISILLIGLSTSLVAHATIYPAWSHVIDTFLITFAFFIFIVREKLKLFNINIAYALIGLIAGMAAYVRSFDVIFLLPYPLFIIWKEGVKKRNFKKMLHSLLMLTAGAIIPAILILLYNKTQYGSSFKASHFYTPYAFVRYFGGINAVKLYLRNLLYYLFNPVRGLIIYSPIALLSFWGIFSQQAKQWKEARFITGFSILLAILGISSYNVFWAGGCFGQRLLNVLFPFLVWGLLMFFQSAKKKKMVMLLAVMLSLYSFAIFNLYIIFWNSGDSRDVIKMAKFGAPISAYTPYDFLRVTWIAYKTEKLHLLDFLYHKIFQGNYRGQLFRFLFSKPKIDAHYFLNTLEFAQKVSNNDFHKSSNNNFFVKHIIEGKKRAIKIRGSGIISYYLKIPVNTKLTLFLKASGKDEEQSYKKLKITIQPHDSPEELILFQDIISLKDYAEWQYKESDLVNFPGKVAKVSFSIETDEQAHSNNYLLISPALTIPLMRAFDAKKMDYVQSLHLPKESIKKTNIIVIACDSLRAEYLGCYGNNKSRTPNIDKFAAESLLFENAYSAGSNNVASMASFFTSTYPLTHSLLNAKHSLNPSLKTLGEILQNNHYQTFESGFALNSLNKGFQTKFPLPKSSPQQFSNKLHNFLTNHYSSPTKKPSFIYILLRIPQSSHKIREGFRSSSDEAFYDILCNIILRKLKEFGLYEESIIILIANRGQLFENKEKDIKIVYNKRNKIPLIMKLPDFFNIKAQRVKGIVENIDVMPTIVELLKLDDRELYMQGKSIIPLLLKKKVKIKECSLSINKKAFILTGLNYEFIDADDKQRLYNIIADLKEEQNIADVYPIFFNYYRTLSYYYKKQLIETKSKNRFDIRFDRKVEKELGSLGYLR